MLLEKFLGQCGQIADFADAAVVQIFFGHFADARDLADIQRRQKPSFLARQHPQYPVRLGLIGCHFGHQARCGDPDRTVEVRLALNGSMQAVCGCQRTAMQSLGAGDVDISFVHGGHFHLRREALEHGVNLARIVAVALGMSVDENGLRA